MSFISLYLKTIPKTINWLALLSTVLLLVKIIVLNRIVEPIRFLYEVGIVFEGVLASVLASCVFYLIVVHLKETMDKHIIYSIVTPWASKVIQDCKLQLVEFTRETGIEMIFEKLTQANIDEAFKKINPENERIFSLGNKANWIQYLYNSTEHSKRYIKKIESQLIFLQASLVSLLMNIDECGHFLAMKNHVKYSKSMKYNDLTTFSKDFFDYCNACKALDTYLKNDSAHKLFFEADGRP
jgi:hypothetical protein